MQQSDVQTADDATGPRVWLVRGGRQGQDESLALESGLAIIGFNDIPDLSNANSREEVVNLVSQKDPGSTSRINNRAAQLLAFKGGMGAGDIVAMPLKTRSGLIALGRVKGPYRYQEINGSARHTRPVEWVRAAVPRTDFQQDLLYSLGAAQTVCRIQRNDAENRIAKMMAGSGDPGGETPRQEPAVAGGNAGPEPDASDLLDIAQIARDQISDHIRSRFPGHDFARLVEAVLRADGYFTLLSPPGPDGGVDILAGRGSLGFEGQKLCVQVKATASAADVNVLRALIGTMQTLKADQGLLVNWGGFTSAAEKEARQSFFTVRLWRADDFVRALFRNYEHLPEQIANEIPLERIWTLVRGDDEL